MYVVFKKRDNNGEENEERERGKRMKKDTEGPLEFS